MGLTYLSLQAYEKAIEYFSMAISKNEKDVDALFELAKCYYYIGNLPKSKKYLLRIIAIEPENEKAVSILKNMENDT